MRHPHGNESADSGNGSGLLIAFFKAVGQKEIILIFTRKRFVHDEIT
jgi:hypothetical protein